MRRPLYIAWVLVLGLVLAAGCGGPRDGGGGGEVERVLVVGVDGLEWRVLDRLIAEGKVPNLARFIEGGTRGELTTLAPAYSPVIWATVATGKLPQKHGITHFVKPPEGPDQRAVPFTSNARTTAALWNILGDLGRRVAVVGWWTTWPAEPVNGVLVSERMLYNRFNLWFGLDLAGGDLPGQTYPPELFDDLADATRMEASFEDEFFERFAPGSPRPSFRRDLHDPWYELLMVHARDRAYAEMLDRILRRDSYEFVAYYLNGPDIASHYFWKYLFPEEWSEPIPSEDVERYREVIPRYYAWVDEAIAPLLAQADAETIVILLSDHGFVTGHRPDSPNISGTHFRAAPPGVLVMAGGGIPAAGEFGRATVMDLTPTILHALGHGVGRDMDGLVLPDVARATGARAVRYVDSYDGDRERAAADPIATEYDEAILEQLRALGYID
jgi:predicted AlkP superfamily pyrophosphatase or phosphodiesterase